VADQGLDPDWERYPHLVSDAPQIGLSLVEGTLWETKKQQQFFCRILASIIFSL
jgi:hypothetical protein